MIMQIIDIYNKFKQCGAVTTDTRTLKGGEMFFALKGENFDGNEYALKALEAGAAYAVVNAGSVAGQADDPRLIKVEDTLKTLQELARWHRSMTFVDGKPLTVVALTGTNGKTTTKELIRAVLSVKYNVTATEGNLNNSIGVPLTLLKINSDTQIAVVEMGASHPGDIKELVDIALPNYGLITNVGKAHLLGFGSFEGVMATKGELYDYLRRTSDKVFLNVDNPHLCRMASERNLQSDPERPYSLVIKELIRAVLSVKYNVTATEGNLNNSIGVPLTLLKINSDTQIAVVEMGASHPGDIKELVDIALPNYGLITNVGKAHLLGFGSFEGVMATKGELYDYLRRTSDKVFLNVDNPHLCRMASERNLQSDPERPYSLVIPYGVDYQGFVVLPSDAGYPYLRISHPSGVISTNLVGAYNADNVMAAIAVGAQFGVTFEDAVKAIEAYVPSNNRSQMVRTDRNVLIVDAYNANPSSMEVALNNLSLVAAESKAAFLGDMLELGEDSQILHKEVVSKLLSMNLSLVCLVGKEFAKACEGVDQVSCFESSDALAAWLKENPVSGTTVLVKGSRGTRMEKVIPEL